MQPLGPTESLNEHWFVIIANSPYPLYKKGDWLVLCRPQMLPPLCWPLPFFPIPPMKGSIHPNSFHPSISLIYFRPLCSANRHFSFGQIDFCIGQPSNRNWQGIILSPFPKSNWLPYFCRLTGPIFEIVSSLVGAEQLPLSTLNLVVVDEFNGEWGNYLWVEMGEYSKEHIHLD